MFVAHVGILFHLLMLPFIAPMLAVLGRVYTILKLYLDLVQGHLKKWTGHSTLISTNPKPLEISLPKFQHFYNYKKYDFSPNLKDVA